MSSQNSPAVRPDARPPTRPEPREEFVYEPSGGLPDPRPQPGWRFAWKRISVYGWEDVNHMHKLMREGWVPCKRVDHPEMTLPNIAGLRNDAPTGDEIVLGGLILMKISEERAVAEERYYDNLTQQQARAVESQYKQHANPDARMPISQEMEARVSFGKGSA